MRTGRIITNALGVTIALTAIAVAVLTHAGVAATVFAFAVTVLNVGRLWMNITQKE